MDNTAGVVSPTPAASRVTASKGPAGPARAAQREERDRRWEDWILRDFVVCNQLCRFNWRKGVESPDDQPHRKDPEVVEDREAALTDSRPQAEYDVLKWPCTQAPARARNPPTHGTREARSFRRTEFACGARCLPERRAYATSGMQDQLHSSQRKRALSTGHLVRRRR